MNSTPIIPSIRRRGEEGSAYVVALLVLVVLTIFGLTLTMMTQTEVQIAANERTANRTFYAAESGLHANVSLLLTENDCRPHLFTMGDALDGSGMIGSQICTGTVIPVAAAPCPLCSINQGQAQFRATHDLVTVAARGPGWAAVDFDGASAISRQSVQTHIELSPRFDEELKRCLQDGRSLVSRCEAFGTPAWTGGDDGCNEKNLDVCKPQGGGDVRNIEGTDTGNSITT